MKKILEITMCCHCIYCDVGCCNLVFDPETKNAKQINTVTEIPSWCPLPDAEEETERKEK